MRHGIVHRLMFVLGMSMYHVFLVICFGHVDMWMKPSMRTVGFLVSNNATATAIS
jgi:hypothetical protein